MEANNYDMPENAGTQRNRLKAFLLNGGTTTFFEATTKKGEPCGDGEFAKYYGNGLFIRDLATRVWELINNENFPIDKRMEYSITNKRVKWVRYYVTEENRAKLNK